MEPEVEGEIKPCPHMRNWVSALADGTLHGFARWFTRLHVKGCPRCREAFTALQMLRRRLLGLKRMPVEEKMPEERWHAVVHEWERIEQKQEGVKRQ